MLCIWLHNNVCYLYSTCTYDTYGLQYNTYIQIHYIYITLRRTSAGAIFSQIHTHDPFLNRVVKLTNRS